MIRQPRHVVCMVSFHGLYPTRLIQSVLTCAMSTSSSHSPSTFDKTRDSPAEFSPVYTNILIQCDRSFASDYSSDLVAFRAQDLVSDCVTSHTMVAAWSNEEAGLLHVSMNCDRDKYSDLDIPSWRDAYRSIEDFDWPTSRQSNKDHAFVNAA